MSEFRLPDLLPFDGDWHAYVEALYETYRRDFIQSVPAVEPSRRWAVKRHPEYEGKHATFWHLVSEGDVEQDRLPDLRRCERLPWARYLVDAALGGHIGTSMYCWEQIRGKERRVLLAPNAFDYVVVLADRKDYVMLWTAFYVDREHRRQRLQNEWMTNKLAAPW